MAEVEFSMGEGSGEWRVTSEKKRLRRRKKLNAEAAEFSREHGDSKEDWIVGEDPPSRTGAYGDQRQG
jgi:hypothetical protein